MSDHKSERKTVVRTELIQYLPKELVAIAQEYDHRSPHFWRTGPWLSPYLTVDETGHTVQLNAKAPIRFTTFGIVSALMFGEGVRRFRVRIIGDEIVFVGIIRMPEDAAPPDWSRAADFDCPYRCVNLGAFSPGRFATVHGDPSRTTDADTYLTCKPFTEKHPIKKPYGPITLEVAVDLKAGTVSLLFDGEHPTPQPVFQAIGDLERWRPYISLHRQCKSPVVLSADLLDTDP
jgi:hypothetical protein